MAFTIVYGIFALFLLIAAAAIAYFLKGWKAALITSAIMLLALIGAAFVLIALITRNM